MNPDAWVPNPHKKITKHHFLEMPALRVIATPSTGVTHIPLDLCKQYGIEVLTLLDDRQALQEIRASSEFAFMMIMMVLKNVQVGWMQVQAGHWHIHEDLLRGNELVGKTVGIIGYGRIGQNVARWCRMMGCTVIYYDPLYSRHMNPASVFVLSDVVLVSCTLNEDTVALVDEKMLLSMKERACLVNISRGAVLDERGVMKALEQRPDLRLAVDVVVDQRRKHPFLSLPRQVLITPHMAGTTYESQEKAARIALNLVRDYGRRQ
jgi:lactate dehydrogenase-like 2-hydroxyacid dehydrogenase